MRVKGVSQREAGKTAECSRGRSAVLVEEVRNLTVRNLIQARECQQKYSALHGFPARRNEGGKTLLIIYYFIPTPLLDLMPSKPHLSNCPAAVEAFWME
jgi:hypothetical protein